MVSLAQTALFGIAGVILGNLATEGGAGGTSKGLHLGWDPTLALVLAIVGTTVIGLIGGAVASRSTGIYFLMITLTYSVIATYTLGQVTKISGFSGIGGINRYTPGWIGNILAHPNRLYYIALGTAVVVYVLIRYVVRTPFGVSLQGTRDEPIRMSSLGYAVPLHRTLAFGFAAFLAALAGVLYVWWSGQIAPGNVDLPQTISLLIMAVIGGLARIEGAWIGAFAFILMDNYISTSTHIPLIGFGGTLFGGSFNTVIGIIFLVDRRRLTRRADGPLGTASSRPGGRNERRRIASAPTTAGVTTIRQRLDSWVDTARESPAAPSKHESEEGTTSEEKQATQLEVGGGPGRRRGRGRGLGDVVARRVPCRDGQGRDHDRLQGRLRVRLRARHRRRAGCVRAVRPRQAHQQGEAVCGHDEHQRDGTPVQIVGYGCGNDTVPVAVTETKRLMEQLGADVMIGPLSGDEAVYVANYAKAHPTKTFIIGTAGSEDPTMQIHPANLFRYHGDGAQWNAGVGEIAYKKLGWRKAAIIMDDYSFGWTSGAGMILDFCAVGGNITKRVFPPLNTTDYAPFVRQLPPPNQVDGYFSAVGGTGTSAMLKAYEQAYGNLDPKKWIGNLFFGFLGADKTVAPKFVGAYIGGTGTGPGLKTKQAKAYEAVIKKWYRAAKINPDDLFVANYYNAAWALVQGLAKSGGAVGHDAPGGAAADELRRATRCRTAATSSSTPAARRSRTSTSSSSSRTPTDR